MRQQIHLKLLLRLLSKYKRTQAQRTEEAKQILSQMHAKNLVVRLKFAAAEARNNEKFTRMFVGSDVLNAIINQKIPVGPPMRDVIYPELYRKLGLEGPHTLFHATDTPPECLSNADGLPYGTLHPGERYSNQKCVYALGPPSRKP
jgi:hypothetical protein